jgi:hypothetical protein
MANRKCKYALLTLVVMLFVITETASGQATAFSYQGRLTDAANPPDGLFDRQFTLFNTMGVGPGIQLTFRWRADASFDFGLAAEDVSAIEPLLVVRDSKGEAEGVRYERLNIGLINAVKEQQQQIQHQR